MKEFKTKAGTLLPLLNLKGKDYLQVAHRLVWFREERPTAAILTEIIERNDKYVICKASIFGAYGADTEALLATAHKREDFSHFSDALEKAETGAIGRALALIGYGTQFTEDFDEQERLADAPLVTNVVRNVTNDRPPAIVPKSMQAAVATTIRGAIAPEPSPDWDGTLPPQGVFAALDKGANESLKEVQDKLIVISKERGWSKEDLSAELQARKIPSWTDATIHQLKEISFYVKGNPKKIASNGLSKL